MLTRRGQITRRMGGGGSKGWCVGKILCLTHEEGQSLSDHDPVTLKMQILHSPNCDDEGAKKSSHFKPNPGVRKRPSNLEECLLWRAGENDQLLPGIPDEITVAQVATKLPWTAFHMLISVSRGWYRAIQSRQVHNARIHSQSAQSLVAVTHSSWSNGVSLYNNDIALYSMKDEICYHLPPMPSLIGGIPRSSSKVRGIPLSCQCVCLDGELYVLGGEDRSTIHCDSATAAVHMLDVVGQRGWKQCASMKNARAQFGCGVIGGKIYVFGGTDGPKPVRGSEVYDPKEDAWSSITPMPSFGFNQTVTPVGEELFVHSGRYYRSDFFERRDVFPRLKFPKWSYSADIYHPINDDWRKVEHFTVESHESRNIVLVIDGKLHKMNAHGIEVYDSGANSWKFSQKIAPEMNVSSDSFEIWPHAAIPVDGELLAVVTWVKVGTLARSTKAHLMKSQGLGCENKEIVWEDRQSSLCLNHAATTICRVLCPIPL